METVANTRVGLINITIVLYCYCRSVDLRGDQRDVILKGEELLWLVNLAI